MKAVLMFLILSTVVFSGVVHIRADYVEPQDDLITYSGSVVVNIKEDGLTLFAATLTVRKYSGEWRKIKGFGNVEIRSKDVRAKADEVTYDTSTKDGKMSGNVVAYIPDGDATLLTHSLYFNMETGKYESLEKSTLIKGDTVATANTLSYSGSTVTLEGDFVSEGSDVSLSGEKAFIDLERDEMRVISSVVVTDSATVMGDELVYDLTSCGTVVGDVLIAFEGEKSSATVKSRFLEFDTSEGVYRGWSDEEVEITKGDMYAKAREFNYNSENSTLELLGEVFVNDEEKDVKIWAERVIIYLNEDRMKAYKARMEIETR